MPLPSLLRNADRPHGTRSAAILPAMTLALLCTLPAGSGTALAANPTGAHRFVFTYRTSAGTPVDIDILAVAGKNCATRPCTLVVAMHGLNRNAIATRDAWLELADRHDLLVAAPHLDAKRFPTRLYQQGGVVGEPDRTKWLYTTIERLYDRLIEQQRAKTGGYLLAGHSAGAQFAHRMAVFMPQGRMLDIVVANAGYYTLPTGSAEAGGHPYPYSLEDTPATEADRKAVLARKLHLLLGDQDNDPDHPQLNTSAGAKAQGPHRLARGKFFFAAAKAEAARLGTPFNWTMTIVPGVGHNSQRMIEAAAERLFRDRPKN